MTESLFLINPSRRKRRMPAGLRRYWAARRAKKNPRRHRRKIHVAHRRRRRNPVSRRRRRSYNMVRRARRAGRRVNPRRRHRAYHRRRRNPIFRMRRRAKRRRNPFGGQTWGAVLAPAAVGMGGALATAIAYGYIAPYLPSQITSSTPINAAAQAALAVGIGALAYMATKNTRIGNAVAIGGVTVVAVNFFTPYFSSFLPNTPGLSGFGGPKLGGVGDYVPYRRPMMGAYLPPMQGSATRRLGFISPAARLGAYLPSPMTRGMGTGMGKYMNTGGQSIPGLGGLFGSGAGAFTGLNPNDGM
jgi:hypothetical protein